MGVLTSFHVSSLLIQDIDISLKQFQDAVGPDTVFKHYSEKASVPE